MKKINLFIVLVIFFARTLAAQDMDALSKAFDTSYTLEGISYYSNAIDVLKKYYDENSYELNLRLGWLSNLAGRYPESIAYYNKAILLNPFAIEPRFGLVKPASSLGNWDQVLEQYEKILEIDPMNTYANYQVGIIYYYREQYDVALKYFELVANLYPFDYDSTLMYAWTSYRLGKMREARILFQKSLLIRPGDESATEGLGLIK
jgi:tetratricopeptide (TPR) repeat protein